MIDDSSFHVESFGFFYGKDESDQTSFSPKMGIIICPLSVPAASISLGQIVFFYELFTDTTCED